MAERNRSSSRAPLPLINPERAGVGKPTWIWVQIYGGLAEFGSPIVCCDCLAHADKEWDVSFASATIRVPICGRCRARWRKRRRLVAVVVTSAVVAAMSVCFYRLQGPARPTAIEIGGFLAIWVAVEAFLVAMALWFFGAPLRMALAGRGEQRVRVRFFNEGFTRSVRAEIARPPRTLNVIVATTLVGALTLYLAGRLQPKPPPARDRTAATAPAPTTAASRVPAETSE
jgi:hypothetical protein